MKRKYAVMLLIMTLTLAIPSCMNIEPIDNYKGSIVYEKYINGIGTNYRFTIRCNDTINNKYYFNNIIVMKLDYNRYNVGDTIK